ncbi:PEP-CTERM sorting domain-containing protein [Cognaticolwellia mytili]|uniref:PEP-CTERM sorting domain-containing protein n=1 Tax=Cognaticolwellia mytili TaxID=1888913 RepID=UPI000A1707A8|nr:PEP-CTERM sorting domain-containing protein [Cognaticolwellia mytili]
MNHLLKKILCPLILLIGFINNAQAGLIENYDILDVNSSIVSNNTQSWFTVNVTDDFYSLTLSLDWYDQGWGNRKGQINFRLNNFDWLSSGLLANHRLLSESVTITRAELIAVNTLSLAPSSPTTLEIGYVVGGGGGHRLHIRDASLTVTNVSNLPAVINVPEPSSLVLLMLAALGFTTIKRRNKRTY